MCEVVNYRNGHHRIHTASCNSIRYVELVGLSCIIVLFVYHTVLVLCLLPMIITAKWWL